MDKRTAADALAKPLAGDRWYDGINTRTVLKTGGITVQYLMGGYKYRTSIGGWRRLHADAVFLGGAENDR